MRLKDKIKTIESFLINKHREIKTQMRSCKLCKGTGINDDPIVIKDIVIPMKSYCSCTEKDGIDLMQIKDKFKRLKKMLAFVDFEVPEVFRANLYVIRETEDFLKSDKKIFWSYSLAKGTGKTV